MRRFGGGTGASMGSDTGGAGGMSGNAVTGSGAEAGAVAAEGAGAVGCAVFAGGAGWPNALRLAKAAVKTTRVAERPLFMSEMIN